MFRWREHGPLSEALDRLSEEALVAARFALAEHVEAAAETLVGIVGDPTVAPATRVRAAVHVLELAGIVDRDGTITPSDQVINIVWPERVGPRFDNSQITGTRPA